MARIQKRIGEILIECGIVNEKQLEKALEIQKRGKRLLGEIIVELGYVTKEKLDIALIRQFGSMLGEILLKNKLITFEQLHMALEQQRRVNRPLGEILKELGYITEESLLMALSIQYKIPYVKLSEYNINISALNKVPIDVCRNCNVLPVDIKEGCLVIATSTPEDLITEQNIRAISGMKVRVVIASKEEIKRRLFP